ncbi:MAG: hypothetical protein M3281_06810 [Chloroflexota bacterium]|nr:hypothetical protein [Chloroflexota bacterium]
MCEDNCRGYETLDIEYGSIREMLEGTGELEAQGIRLVALEPRGDGSYRAVMLKSQPEDT